MFKKLLTIGILAGVLATGAMAQEGSRVANPVNRIPHPIGNAEVIKEADTYTLVVSGDLPDGCASDPVIKTERVGAVWFVDIYRELPFDVICTEVITPYEQRIDAAALFTLDDDATLVSLLVVNGKIFGVERAQIEATEGASAPAPILITTYVRGVLPYNRVSTRHLPEGEMEITLAGTLTDGCAMPVYRAYEDWQNPGFVVVDAYTAINIAAMCMQVETPFEAVMRAPLFETFAVNGVSVPYDLAVSVDVQNFEEQQMAITNVTTEWVEGLLPNLKITIVGMVDGCDFPIQAVPGQPVDNTYIIKVVRVMPENTACIEIAREFTEELYISPDLSLDYPVVLYINDQAIKVENE